MSLQFTPTMLVDTDRIAEWTAADPWHKKREPPTPEEWWLTGTGYLSFCVRDEIGPIVFVKIEEEELYLRLHCQFGPRKEVGRDRVLEAMKFGLPVLFSRLLKAGKSIIFSSENPSLIKFMASKGFVSDPSGSGDYILKVVR